MQPGLLVAALAASVAAALLLVPGRPRRTRRGPQVPGQPLAWAAAAAVAGVALVGVRGTHLAVAALGAAALWLVSRALDRSRAELSAEVRRRAVVDYCEGLLGELEAGQPVQVAVQRSVALWPDSAPVAAAAGLGADVPAALRAAASAPGAGALRRLAAAWELSAATGAGLTFALRQVIRTARAEQAVIARIGAELASARATARLVTILPGFVLLAAQGVGAEPWHFLLDTVPGVGCLAGGLALTAVGLRWIDAIGDAARGPGR